MSMPFFGLRLTTVPAAAVRTVHDDFPQAFIPQLWANESIAILNVRGL